jgi:hypothetical protein
MGGFLQMIPLNINFLKSQPTVGDLRKVTREAQSPIKFSKGDEIVGLPQSCPNKFECQSPQSPDLLSQININNIKNTETLKGDVIRSMGIEVL